MISRNGAGVGGFFQSIPEGFARLDDVVLLCHNDCELKLIGQEIRQLAYETMQF